MEKMNKTTKLFNSISIGDGLNVKHRIVLAPLTRFRAHKDSQVQKSFVSKYYEQRASCRGLLISEATSIHVDAASYEGVPGIYSEKQVEAWKDVVQRVHDKGAGIFLQLWHVGRSSHSSLLGGNLPVSSSSVPIRGIKVRSRYTEACGGLRDPETPRALSAHEIPQIVEQYGKAAQAGVEGAGFDGVEIHAANGYLPDQFLRDGVNQRTDNYGGSFENRIRFLLEIVHEISKRVGEKKTGLRLSPFSEFKSMSDSDPLGLFTFLLEELQKRYPNLAYVHLCAFQEGKYYHNLDGCEKILNLESSLANFRRAWKGVLLVNLTKIEKERAIQLVEQESVDMVAVGRDFLANPDLPFRWQNDLELNEPDASTFYTHEEKGLTDYPFHPAFLQSKF